MAECSALQLTHSAFTIQHRSLAYKDYPANSGQPSIGKILVIGGIHGDEFSSVSVIVKWMKILNQQPSNLFDWRFIPSANPDGLLQIKSQRQNYNGVDLNRNFPTADWQNHALNHWQNVTHRNPRRRPGPRPASEPETKWLVDQINTFAPEVIITLHAPYHLVDYDGPPSAPDNLGGLYLRRLGVFPGSLGNYAGNDLNKPVVTLELKSAGIMPLKQEIDQMWYDLVIWLQTQLSP
ncbi:MAG: succinylglutamate desuccinylase/aspartoacylase family protein [Pseudomonadales bacterium]|nr:succinylglutamate desuccinylase/aspartoacylase family protein [Pseudomonadales bacterium]